MPYYKLILNMFWVCSMFTLKNDKIKLSSPLLTVAIADDGEKARRTPQKPNNKYIITFLHIHILLKFNW